MALVDARGFNLVPDVGGSINQGLQLAGNVQALQAQQQKMDAAREKQRFDNVSRWALQLQSIKDPQQRIAFLENQKNQNTLQGLDSLETQEVLDAYKSGDPARIQAAENDLNSIIDVGVRMGSIKPESFTNVQTRGGIPSGIKGGVLQPIPTTPELTAAISQSPAEVSEVQSSKILPGGLVQITRKDGTAEVVQLEDAERELVKSAELRGAELQGLRSGQREAATGAMKQSIAAFKQLTPVKKGIRNIEEGIKLIDEGAKSGVVQSKLPSVRAASVKLDNVQAQLGLDVIGNTTFGALSESELRFALDSALPKNLEPQELRKWLVEKRDAQTKLADYIEESAIFLGTPGNSVADFLKMKKSESRQQPIGRFKVEVVE